MARTVKEQIGVDLPEQTPIVADPIIAVADAEDRPEWLPENFKEPAELAASYKNLQDDLRRRGEDQKRLEAQIESLTQAVEAVKAPVVPQQNQQVQSDAREQLLVAFENDPIGTMAYLANQYATQATEAKFQEFTSRNDPQLQAQANQQNQLLAMSVDRALADAHEDWPEYKGKVAEAIQQDPALLPEQITQQGPEATMRALDRVYKLVKADEVYSQVESGNFVTDQMKRQAQTMSGTLGRPGTPSPDDEKFARLKAAAKDSSYAAFRGGA